MPDVIEIQKFLLIGSAVFLSAVIFFCLLRVALGPGFSDRITAASTIGTKVIALSAVLALIIGEGYLVDICLICAVVSFLSVLVLSRSVTGKKEGR